MFYMWISGAAAVIAGCSDHIRHSAASSSSSRNMCLIGCVKWVFCSSLDIASAFCPGLSAVFLFL